MEEREDCIIISPPKDIKQTIIAFIAIFPLCFIDWIAEWMGFERTGFKIASLTLSLAWITGAIGEAFVYNTEYRIDRNGVVRTYFEKYKKSISWSEMKFVGWCAEAADVELAPVNVTRYGVLFSKVSFSQYNKCHLYIQRIIENRNCIFILNKYIDDETYEKILEFSGGERNIQ